MDRDHLRASLNADLSLRLAEAVLLVAFIGVVGPTRPAPAIVLMVGLIAAANLDLAQQRFDVPTDGRWRVLGRLALAGLLLAVLLPAQQQAVLRATLVAGGTTVLWRTVGVAVQRWRRRHGRGLTSTVIVGAGPTAQLISRILLARPEFGMRPIGFLDRIHPSETLPLAVLGAPEDLDSVLLRYDARRAILAFGPTRERDLVEVVRTCSVPGVQFYALPRFFELGLQPSAGTTDVRGFPLTPLRSTPRSWRLKRAFDVVVAGVLLVATLPLLGLTALAVRLSGPGPILFRQERVGLHGQRFDMLKLRTMHPNDDGDRTWTVEGDDRVTRAGRVLRPTHLDELPQLINVLRGEMSLVGPRPERPTFVEEFEQKIPGYTDRHRLPVGITGWAQVNGLWGDSSIEERARFDNRYIETWSLIKDMAIVLRTIPTLLGRRDDASGGAEGVTPFLPSDGGGVPDGSTPS